MPSAKAHHENIISTFLPNLVDARNSESRPPEQVFANYLKELEKLTEIAKVFESNPAARDLTTWLKR